MGSKFSKANPVASSARCESYFKELKAYLSIGGYRPLRADKLIGKHLRWIENSTKLERAAILNKVDKNNKNEKQLKRKLKTTTIKMKKART